MMMIRMMSIIIINNGSIFGEVEGELGVDEEKMK